MSIQRRLLVTIVTALMICVLIAGVLIYFYALNKVHTEMEAAISVGSHIVQNALDDKEEMTNARRRLRLVVADFDGDRHLIASLVTDKNILLARSTPLSPDDTAPDWFVRLVEGDPLVARPALPSFLGAGEQIVLQTTASNEVAEAWSDVKLTVGTLGSFCALILFLIYWIVSRALRPIEDVCDALSTIGEGDYSTRLTQRLPAELAPLKTGFNAMAERLTEMEAVNGSLTRQLVNLEEEERAQIARDLHDEVGPFLFATSADATMIRQLLATSAWAKASERADAILESVRHMQKHLRSVLGRLRPGALIDLGLDKAIEGLVEFWRTRRTDINFSVAMVVPTLGREIDGVIFRVVQESLNNAVRHGKPTTIQIVLTVADGDAQMQIIDDGGGFVASRRAGFGLSGMQERVVTIGGTFSARNRPEGQGAIITARIPLTGESAEIEDELAETDVRP